MAKQNKRASNLAALTLSLAAACGGTEVTNNYIYGPNGEVTYPDSAYDNPCESPIYGARLWNIAKCDSNYYMAKDCSLQFEGPRVIELNYVPDPRQVLTYRGFDIHLNGNPVLRLHPNFEFNPDQPHLRAVNQLLKQHAGRVFVEELIAQVGNPTDFCTRDHVDDCVYIREETPITDIGYCASKYPFPKYQDNR